ncbi:MAG: SdpI family protein [Aequorivita sp.]
MKFHPKKEVPLILLAILPALFLAYVWNNLPERLPMQWGLDGEVNRYGDSWELLIIVIMPIFFYVLFLFIPRIDPKKRLDAMGKKYYSIRLLMAVFIGVLFMFIIYSIKEQALANPNYIFIIIGAFFMLLGNYFKTIKPNYFVGIRTPWTLESEAVWKSTHKLAGKLWVPGGLIVVVSGFLFAEQTTMIIFFAVTAIIALVPVGYSYFQYKKQPRELE